ncbi:MAG: hypothetical protein JWM27_3518 [Gemmatimonadetes bacterium]|nr:hypothetical protein [Gemmatimonadota bacterium]
MENAEVTADTWNEDRPGREAERLVRRFVCRISGAPVDGVEQMRATRTLERLDALLAAEDALAERREAVSALLFAAIGAAGDDGAARKRLLRARRELFNLRPLPAEVLEGACAQLSTEQASEVGALQQALVERDALAAEVAAAYGEESGTARAAFRQLLRDPEFRKGLLVSSRSLHASLDRYTAGTAGALSGKDEKTERGLLRYYTRMAMKATPFAAFCAVVPGRFTEDGAAEDGEGGLLRLHGDPRAKRSFVRINKLLYGILLDHLKERPGVRRRLVVEPNPTLRTEGARLVFLSAVQGREVFQRVAANEVLQVITQVFAADPAPTLGDLVDRLTRDPQIDASTEEAEAYLEKLIEIGFLRFHTGIREQDADWDLPFAALLDALDDEHATRAAALLRQVRERTDAYAAAPVERREAVVAEIHAAIDEAFTAMEVKARLRKDMPFYEDATADADATVALTPGVRRATDALVDWARLTSRLAWPRAEQATMRHFFDMQYGDRHGVPLLQFYEDFYREHFKAHVEKEQKARGGADKAALEGYDVNNPFKLPFIQALNEARMRLQERIVARWREAPDAAEVTIPLAEVEEALAGVEPQPAPCRSVSAFTLLVPPREEGGDPAFLLQSGSYTAGYGKYFSRFLYMLPEDFLEEVRAGNQALTDELLAEICGDAQFNANLHPSLMRWEISYPTGESGDAADQLRSSDLFVEPDPEDPHSLALRHGPSGRRVIPVDLGFLNPRMRPPLYQLLSRFTPPVTFAPSVPETPVNPPRPAPPADGVPVDAAADTAAPVEGVASPDTADAAAPEASAAAQVVASDGVAKTADGEATDSIASADAGAEAATAEDASAEETKAEAPPPAPPEISHRPRISIGGRVLVTRRRWLVPGVLVPQRAADETAADFFVRATRWRRDAGLPESCYVRMIPIPDPAAKKPGDETPAAMDAQEAAMNVGAEAMPAADEPEQPEAAKAAEAEGAKAEDDAKGPPVKVTTPSRDFYKPQFMDFGNPLLVGLLGKLAAGVKHFNVIVEERLPGPDALAEVAGGRWATEMVVQLDFPEGTANAGAAPARGEAHAALA